MSRSVSRPPMGSIVVVGGGLAGATAAGALRSEGYDGAVVLVGEESHPPYNRPPLSKGFLTGSVELPELHLHPSQWYAEREIDVRTGERVWSIDPKRRAVVLDDGREIHADGVILATGARPRVWPGPAHGASSSDRVHYLRTVADAGALAAQLRPDEHVVVLGAGLVGAEVAAAARSMGAEVTLIELGSTPMELAVGKYIGGEIAHLHRSRGVDLRSDTEVVSIEVAKTEVVLRTRAGEDIAGTRVLVALGAVPNTDVAVRAGLAVNNGVALGAFCDTSLERVFAAGDVASMADPTSGRFRRFEHVNSAIAQAGAAAKNVLGKSTPCIGVYSFDSEQYGYRIDSAGSMQGADRAILHTSADTGSSLVLYFGRNVFQGVAGINRSREVRRISRRLGEVGLVDSTTLIEVEGQVVRLEGPSARCVDES